MNAPPSTGRRSPRAYALFSLFSLFSLLYFSTGDPRYLWNLTFLSFLMFLGYLRPDPKPTGATPESTLVTPGHKIGEERGRCPNGRGPTAPPGSGRQEYGLLSI